MTNDIKEFIKKYVYLLDNNRWDMWFELIESSPEVFETYSSIGRTTKFLMDCGCEPLKYLTYLPDGFLAGSDVDKLILPANITQIGKAGGRGMKYLSIVDIPENCTWIGDNAFEGCIYLDTVVIRNPEIKFGKYVFFNCIRLSNVIFEGTLEEWKSCSRPLGLVDVNVKCLDSTTYVSMIGEYETI